MATGIECTGIVLGVAPLVIEAGKAYAEGVDALADVALQSRHDKKLQSFYEHFWWEMVELNTRVRDMIDSLPRLSSQRKIELASASSLENWTNNADVDEALKVYLITVDNYKSFMVVMTRLVSMLSQLVKDSTLHINMSDTVSSFDAH